MVWKVFCFSSVKQQKDFVIHELEPKDLRKFLAKVKIDKLTREKYDLKINSINKQPKNADKLDELGMSNAAKDWMRNYKDGECVIIGEVIPNDDNYDVVTRSAVFLDIDHNANELTRAEFEASFPHKAFIHDSFNSTEREPKFRVIVPLNGEYTLEDFNLAWDYCASFLPENCLDKSAKQFKRKFYLPRAMPGALFSFTETKAKSILGSADFKASKKIDEPRVGGEEKKPSKHGKRAAPEAKTQKNPLSKSGHIGAFCKSYSIIEAIKTFIPDVYVPGSKPNRLTYSAGTTTDGVVLYGAEQGGLFAYSHHDSDPCGGSLRNAFDLVRIHKFGDNSDSFQKMANEIIFKDEKTQKLLEANYLFVHTENGELKQTIGNCLLAFKNDAMLNGKIALNESDNRIYLLGAVDWSLEKDVRPITNTDYAGVTEYLETKYGLSVPNKIEQAILLEAYANRYDPVKDYLDSLPEWDGVERIATLLHDYLNAEKSAYTAEVTKLTLIGAIKRIYEQGCKFETMLVLVSPEEGIGKSTLFLKLAGEEFFSDQFDTMNGKESFEQLTGGWIIESAELEGMRRNDVQKIYKFLSKTRDKYRPAYGRVVETFKRRCIFVGTTNEDEFLRGSGANRRFYPVPCSSGAKKSVFTDLVQDEVNQIWAEAMVYYRRGDTHFLAEDHLADARKMQESHKVIDDRVAMVIDYLDMPVPKDWHKKTLTERRLYRGDKSLWKGEPVSEVPAIAIWYEVLNTNVDTLATFTNRESTAVRYLLSQVKNFRQAGKKVTYTAYAQQRVWERI